MRVGYLISIRTKHGYDPIKAFWTRESAEMFVDLKLATLDPKTMKVLRAVYAVIQIELEEAPC